MTRSRPKSAPARAAESAEGSRRIANAIQEQQRVLSAVAALDTVGVEDVHRTRVAARRLRSVLKTFGPLLESRRARLYRVDLRSYARALAGVREADVRRELLAAIAGQDTSVPPAERKRLDLLLEDACIGAREALRRHRSEPGWAALCGALTRHAANQALIVEHKASLARVLSMVARAWRKPVRLLKVEPDSADELHELRLALKHCRYALEPVADVAPKATARLLRRLRGAQDAIGEHRDLMLAEHWLRSNERQLGRELSAQLVSDLQRRERQLRRLAARRSRKVYEAYSVWRAATRRLTRETKPGRE
jgi:CHAD domain-containing protein